MYRYYPDGRSRIYDAAALARCDGSALDALEDMLNEEDFKWLEVDDGDGQGDGENEVGTQVHFGFHEVYGGVRPSIDRRVRVLLIDGDPHVTYTTDDGDMLSKRVISIEVPDYAGCYIMVR